jgi:hypothetical protein
VNNSKLVNILRTFSKTEVKEFEKFILSPYFNRGRNYIPFFSQIKKFHPRFDNEKMTPEYIYSKMYPGRKFNKQIIWNMTSRMMNLAEEFLIHISLKKNRFVKDYQLAEELHDRKLASYYDKKLNDVEKGLDRMGWESNYFQGKAQLERGRMSFHFLEDTQHLISKHVMKKGEYTILNFMKDLSDVISDLEANTLMFNAKFELNMPHAFISNLDVQKIIEYAIEHKFKYASILEMYYQSMMMVLKFDDTAHFFRFKQLFEMNYNKFGKDERLKWYTSLTNYCSNKISKGVDSFRSILFEIHNSELKEGIIFSGKYLSKILFIQILRNALSINETVWAKHYIEEYGPKLKPSYQKPMKALGMAFYCQKMKEHEKVLENLGKVNFIDVRDKLYVRFLYIRTYYDLSAHEALISYIDSTVKFLNKNSSINDNTRKNYLAFIANLNRLINAKEKNDILELDILKKQFDENNRLLFRTWLLEKIEEINKKMQPHS